MQTVSVGTQAILTVTFADDAGNAVAPQTASYTVLDGDGNVLVSETAILVSGPQAQIALAPEVTAAAGARTLLLAMVTATGTVTAEVAFGVTSAVRLALLQNTFQTYAQALFTARDLPNLTSLTGAAKADQEVALIEAFRRLTLLNYYIPWPEFVDVMNYLNPRYAWHITPRMWPNMTVELYNEYPEPYHRAMRNAQVIEANTILKGSKLDDKLRAGLLAWTVGESKMMFKSGMRPLSGVVGRDACDALKGFLNTTYSLTRS